MPEANTAGQAAPAPGIDTPEGIAALGAAIAAAMNKTNATSIVNLSAFAGAISPTKAPLLSRLTPRMLACLVLTGILVAGVAVLSPAQLPVSAYKLSLVTLAGYLGYWLDRWAFPYARPDSFLEAADWRAERQPAADQANHPVVPGCEQIYAASMLRRALVMLGAMLAMGLGL